MKQLLLITTFLALMTGVAMAQPQVNGTTPSRNAVNITSDANINIGFNQTMDASTLNASTILVFGTYRGKYTGTVSYSGTTAVFNPDEDYLPGEVITVTVTTGAESSGNVAMARAFTFSFTAEADGDGLFKPEVSFSAVPSSQADDVVTADLNGDGLIDIAVLSQGSTSISVHFNNGDETFASPVVLSTASIPMNLIATDLDGDGVQDLAVANYTANSLSVFMNNGDETFATRVDYSTPSSLAASDLVALDLTGNGHQDIVQLHINNPNPGQYLFIYPNNGDGTFGTATQFTIADLDEGGNLALSYKASSTSSQNWRPHLLVTDNAANQLRVYENDGSGTSFVYAQTLFAGTDPGTVTSLTLSSTGSQTDVVVANTGSDNITVYGQSSGTFNSQTNFSTGDYPFAISGGDLDGDGDNDLVIANNSGGTLSYMPNTTGTFYTNNELDISGNPNAVALADLNNDGKLDIISANTNGTLSILYNYPGPEVTSISPGNGTTDVSNSEEILVFFSEGMDASTLNSTNITVSGSVNGSYSGTYSYNSGDSSVTINPSSDFVTGETVTVTVTTNVTNSIGTAIIASATSSFDIEDLAVQSISPVRNANNVATNSNIDITFNDSMDDATLTSSNVLIDGSVSGTVSGVYSYNAGINTLSVDPANDLIPGETITVHVTENVTNSGGIALSSDYLYSFTAAATGGEIFQSPADFDFTGSIRDLKFVDFDNDDDADIVTGESGGLGVYLNDGNGGYTFSDTTTSSNSQVNKIAIADFDQDGYMDAAGAIYSQAGYFIKVYINDQAGSFNVPVNYSYSTNNAEGIEAADINQDGYPDIVATRYNADAVHVLLNDGDGTFTAQSAVTVGGGPYLTIQLIDVDSDNDLDLVTSDWDDNTISVAKNNGDGTFATHSSFNMTGSGVYTGFFDSGDIDGDGDLDLVASQTDDEDDPVEGLTVFFNDGSGDFSTTSSISETARDVKLMDIDGDGDLDIVLAAGGEVKTLLNNGSGSFTTSPYSASAGSTFIYGIDASDIDGDGDLDLAAGSYSALHIFENGELVNVSSTSPSANGLDVSASSDITVTFGTNMDVSTFQDTSVIVTGSRSGVIGRGLSLSNPTLTIDPTNNFIPGEVVTVLLTNDLINSGGTALYKPYSFSFTVGVSGNGDMVYQDSLVLNNSVSRVLGSDIDEDGDEDLLAIGNGYIDAYELDAGSYSFLGQSTMPSGFERVYPADLDQDGDIDLAIHPFIGTNQIRFLENNGSGSFTVTDTLVVSSAPDGLVFEDFDGDGITDLAYIYGAQITIINWGQGNFEFSGSTSFGGGSGYPTPSIITSGDVDNDGDIDIVLSGDDKVIIGINGGSRSFDDDGIYDVATDPEDIELGDFNGDGYLDIVVTSEEGAAYSIFINNQDGSFAEAVEYSTAPFWAYDVTAFDYDGDGDLDLGIYLEDDDSGDSQMLFAYNQSGVFSNQLGYELPTASPYFYDGAANSYALVDIDGDTDLDLASLVRNGSGNSTFAFSKNEVGNSVAPTTAASSVTFSSIAAYSAKVSWTNGDGARRMVLVKEGSAVDATPVDDSGYSPNSEFGSGSEIGTGNFAVYGGASNSVTVTGLDPETEYHVQVFELNGIPGSEKFLTTGAPVGNFTSGLPPTIWSKNDSTLVFTKADNADWTQAANQDRITDNLWLTRQDSEGLFNYADEIGWNSSVSPSGTMWAFGTTDDLESLTFDTFSNTLGQIGNNIEDADMVVYSESDDLYFDINFSSWTGGDGEGNSGGGGFSYTRAKGPAPTGITQIFDDSAGFAVKFDGGSSFEEYIEIYIEDYEIATSFTTELWVKPDVINQDQVFLALDADDLIIGINSSNQFYATHTEPEASSGEGGEEECCFKVNPASPSPGTQTIIASAEIDGSGGLITASVGEWYHVALSGESGGLMTLYVNGVEQDTASIENVVIDDSYWVVGSDEDRSKNFNGTVDELRIWKSVRTESQIRSYMHQTYSGQIGRLTGYWQFNEGTGSYTYDGINNLEGEFYDGVEAAWVTSDAPLGNGTVDDLEDFQNGSQSIGKATIDVGADAFDNPIDVQVTEVTGSPNQFPSGFTSGIGDKYFVINLFGDPGTFSANLTLTYGPGVITSIQESNPSLLKLYKRSSNSSGAWTEIASATTASAATGVVTWNGITSFSQFIAVAEEYVPPTLDIQISNGADVVAYTDSAFEFSSSFFDLADGFVDSTITISVKSELDGNLYLDQNSNGTYDSGTDDQLTANAEFIYTPSGSIKLIYAGSFAGVDTATVKLQSSTDADSVLLDFYTIEATPTLQGNTDENGWYLLSNPVDSTVGMLLSNIWTQGAVNSDAPSGDATLYRFIQDSAQYVAITTDLDTTKLAAGEGLLAYIFEDDDILDGQDDVDGGWPKTLTNYGNPFGTDVSIPVKNVDYDGVSGTTSSEGFALLGNPYGWPLSADSVIATLKREDALANSYVYRWDAVNKTYKILSTGSIEPYESVFVRLISSGTSADLSFDYNDAIVGPSKKAQEEMLEFNLAHAESGIESASRIRFDEKGKADIDPYDGYYLGSYATKFANLYSVIGDQPLTINNLPKGLAEVIEIPIYMDATISGDFELSWDKAQIPEGWTFELEEKKTGSVINLADQESLSFTSNSWNKAKTSAPTSLYPFEGSGKRTKSSVTESPMFVLKVTSKMAVSNEGDLGIPTEVELYQNYPNPFNPTSVIRFGVPEASKIKLEVFDVLGRKVMTLLNNETRTPGRYNVQFDARTLSSGMYIYRLVVGDKVMTKKMTLIK